jgi:Ca-activated chloride channel family protein
MIRLEVLMPRRAIFSGAVLASILWPQDAPVFRVDANLVIVPCVLTDSRGAPVADLKLEEFRLYDNGAPRHVSNLWREGDLPLTVGVIIDASASQRAFIREHEATVERFLERVIKPQDRAFVVRVNEKVVLASEFVGRPDGLHFLTLPSAGKTLGEPCPTLSGRSLCGGTDLWDAVFFAAREKLNAAKGGKALVILSDGNDTGSIHAFAAALKEVQLANAAVYAIRYPDSSPGVAASENLARLSLETGGLPFDPPRGNLNPVLSRVEADLRTRYVLGFMADAAKADQPHRIQVDVTRPGLTVRSRREYVPSPD